ncbi:MAG: hypothetical protein ABI980_11015 [Nitrospirota bacterium]
MDDGTLLDAAAVAFRLGMAKSSIYRMSAAGIIPSYACGPKLSGRRFDIGEVKAALKALAQKTVSK